MVKERIRLDTDPPSKLSSPNLQTESEEHHPMTRPKQPTLTPSEVLRLLDELRTTHPRVAAVAYLMAYCGLRLNEARVATWGWFHDLEHDAATIHIPDDQTKTRWPRTLPVPRPLRTYLLTLKTVQHLTPPVTPPDSWPLVLNRWGAPPSKRYIQTVMKWASREALGRSVRCHTLRHTFATNLLQVSNLRVVQTALGHRSIRSTQVYTHPQLNDVREAMTALLAKETNP